MLGNPYKIKEIINYLEDKEEKENYKKLDIIKEHLELTIKEKGEYIAIREMRKHICWYIRKLPESSKIREEINKIDTSKKLIKCLEEYFNNM